LHSLAQIPPAQTIKLQDSLYEKRDAGDDYVQVTFLAVHDGIDLKNQ